MKEPITIIGNFYSATNYPCMGSLAALNEADTERTVRKRRVVGRIYGMKYS